MVKKYRSKKRSSKTLDIISYALKVSENGASGVFVAHFRSSNTFYNFSTGLAVNIHVSTKTCVTGNNFILHKALKSDPGSRYYNRKFPPWKHYPSLVSSWILLFVMYLSIEGNVLFIFM